MLPQPTRFLINSHAEAIDRAIRRVIESHPYAIMTPRPPKYPDGFFAEDNFHPSEQGYKVWAKFAIEDALGRGALQRFGSR
jgi:lysophospholipase L1-like esterase